MLLLSRTPAARQASIAGFSAITPGAFTRHILERYAVYNPGFRLTDSLLGHGPTTRAFDRYLQANTGFTADDVPPVSIDVVRTLEPLPPGEPPLVFLFVVDSFRRDYMSPYNPAVDFTPRFAEFAAENLAFTNAFTRYGGTALSMMDEVAFIAATRFSRLRCVTVSSDRIDFTHPIPAGTIIELVGRVETVGNTSMKVRVDIFVEKMYEESREKAVTGIFTFVALDEHQKPVRILGQEGA